MKMQDYILKRHSIKNTTNKYLLVGDASKVIAAYDTKEEAVKGLEKEVPSICESEFGVVDILVPGAEKSAELAQPRPRTAKEEAEHEEICKKEFERYFGETPSDPKAPSLNLDFDADNAPRFEISEGAKHENQFATHEQRRRYIEGILRRAGDGVFEDRHATLAKALDKLRAEQEEVANYLERTGRPEGAAAARKLIEQSHLY